MRIYARESCVFMIFLLFFGRDRGKAYKKQEAATHHGLQPPTKNYYGNNLVYAYEYSCWSCRLLKENRQWWTCKSWCDGINSGAGGLLTQLVHVL